MTWFFSRHMFQWSSIFQNQNKTSRLWSSSWLTVWWGTRDTRDGLRDWMRYSRWWDCHFFVNHLLLFSILNVKCCNTGCFFFGQPCMTWRLVFLNVWLTKFLNRKLLIVRNGTSLRLVRLVWNQWQRSTESTRFLFTFIFSAETCFISVEVDLKVDDVRARLDKNGNIRKNDFIEFSIETKLLDLADRKISEGGQSKVIIRARFIRFLSIIDIWFLYLIDSCPK